MANEKENVLQANAGASATDIPDLKKKDKERKKAGAAWSGANGGAASDFVGATGGNGARAAASIAGASASAASAVAESAILSAGELAGGGLWATVSGYFAGLAATVFGRVALAVGALLLATVAGLFGYALFQGKGGGASAKVGAPDLGGISDSMRVRAGGNDRMGVASKGELRFDPLSDVKPGAAPHAAAVEEKKAEDKPAPDVKPVPEDKPVPSGQLAHNLSGATLSSSLGGDFGGKNIFAGNSSAPKFSAGKLNSVGVSSVGLPKFHGTKGQIAMMKPTSARGTPSKLSLGRATSNRAIGQLKMAKGMSQLGVQSAGNDGARQAATDAFDQQKTNGGNLATIGAPGGDASGSAPVSSPSDGTTAAPDLSMPAAPATPTSGATDPGLQNELAQIEKLANEAMQDMKTGLMEIAAGIAMIAAGIAGLPWTAALIAAGVALMIMGIMEVMKAMAEAAEAMALGKQLANQIQNEQQGAAVNYCTNQAVSNGTPVQDCNPPDSVTNANQQTATGNADVQQAQQIPADSPVITQ